jgi:ubiquinone/menaquinone biosynthesis C-methylase UbiE
LNAGHGGGRLIMQRTSYIIRGGVEGRERLRLLANMLRPTTRRLFEEIRFDSGIACLDCGCGGGDVTFELARRTGPTGRVLGLDIDDVVLELARGEAASQGLNHVEFRRANIDEVELGPVFDLVYSRFLLTHLPNPQRTLAKMHGALRPGGVLLVEDVDFEGHFSHPECDAFRQYVRLYSEVSRRLGHDPNIGRRLPELLSRSGFDRVEVLVAQPAALDGDAKRISPITMELIADSILTEGLANKHEVDRIIAELHEFARDPRTLLSAARIVQSWGHKPRS